MSALYSTARKAFADGDIDLLADDIRIILIDTADYTVDLATHNALDDVAAGARVATSAALTGKTTTDGVFDHDDVAIANVTGDTVEAVVYYKHTGTESTSQLIAYVDSASSGLPLTPNGGAVTVQPDAGANKAFKL